MGPRVKPEDDDVREVRRQPPALVIGECRPTFVILGLDPRTHSGTKATVPAVQAS